MARGPVEVRWHDAFVPQDEWHDHNAIVLEKRVMSTIGWVILQERDYLVVASTYDPVGDHYAQAIAIPRGCIIKPIRDVPELPELPDAPAPAPAGPELPAADGDVRTT